MTLPSLQTLSLVSSVAGATAVMIWRVRETRSAVTARSILIPPMGMATGLSMFILPMFRIPWAWALTAFFAGALVLARPVLRTSRLMREGERIVMQRSHALLLVLAVLALIRIGARGYLDSLLSVQQTASLFFLVGLGMILRWRAQMYLAYRQLSRT